MLVLKADILEVDGVAHGFFGRTGGVSQGIYASLNCAPASHDDRDAVAENRKRVAAYFAHHADEAMVPLVSLQQHHSADTLAVDTPWTTEASPMGDALVTDKPDIVLAVNTADCAPVLLADPEARIIGAAHAGWKGALGGVCESAVAAMEKLGAMRGRIRAAIGPCISQPSYEVGPDFRAAFPEAAARFFEPSPVREGHFQFALEAYVAERLHNAGIDKIESFGACTLAHPDRFFSMRRSTLAGETDYGRECSAIMLMK